MPSTLTLADMVAARAPGPGYVVFDSEVPSTPPTAYVVLYYGAGLSTSTTLAAVGDRLRWQFTAVCVGSSRKTAMNTVDKIRDRFISWRPLDVNGPMFFELDASDLAKDDLVANDVRFYSTLTYRLYTNRS